MPVRALLSMLLVSLLAGALTGCREEREPVASYQPVPRETQGEPRGFLLGFSSVPADLTDEAYVAAFDMAAQFGEVLLIQRPPSWEHFLSGGQVTDVFRDSVVAERNAADARGLRLMVALDPFDPNDRGRLRGLPESHVDRDLADPEVRQAFLNEAVFIARNQQPAFFALGSEVNTVFERDPSAYANFVTLYTETYRAVKAASPDTKVFVTFQYEELLGVIPWQPPHAPRWELIEGYGTQLDLFAITSYPSFAYSVARKVPPRYYEQIQEHTDLPIAFASVGYASEPGREGLNSSTAPEQRRFLQRLLEDVERLGSPLLVWFAARDLRFASEPPYDLLASIGLRDGDGAPKEAWPAWEQAALRPFDPEAGVSASISSDDRMPPAEATATPIGEAEGAEEPATPEGD
ncbi:MAG: hypothetical protein GEU80_05375 [Dehalococcoidia bacterium]|nr:hypothetical protein [Dehalococcoidia bacterium]